MSYCTRVTNMDLCYCVCVFFFKQKTAYEIVSGDWSSDVCSSDLFGEVTLISRKGNDWTRDFPEVRVAMAKLGVRSALIDGEVAIVLPDGRTSFQALQNSFAGGDRRGLTYFVFDLLYLDGRD